MGRLRSEQVPSVAGDVEEDNDASVRLIPWLGDELHAGRAHPFEGVLEVVRTQKQPNSTRELVPDRAGLMLTVSPGEKQRGGRTGRPYNDPALRPASLVKDGEASTSSNPRMSTKNRMASS